MLERRLLPSEDFPLPYGQPLSPKEVVAGIGTFKRHLDTRLLGRFDFPQPVLVATIDQGELLANLVRLFSDTASQADGTFYFDRTMRIPEGIRATNFLWGREIYTITFLSNDEKIPQLPPE